MATTTRVTPPTQTRGTSAGRGTPPQWALERLLARMGKVPAALGKFLDRLARIKGPVGWVVKFFSTVWVGILFLILTGGYIAVGSGFASLRARMEMTDLQFFDAWPMVTLLVLLATSLITVTLRKIPLTIFKLGVWTVHIGILVMLTGCFIYFSQKVEGLTRIFLGKSVDVFYDSTERALYVTRMDPADPTRPAGPEIMVPLKTLPFFNEYLAINPQDQSPGTPLDMVIPREALAADEKLRGVGMTITGYYPFADIDVDAMAGPATMPAVNPAVRISAGNSSVWLVADSPARRVVEMDTLGFEYLYHPSPERVAVLSLPAPGGKALAVRIPKLGILKVYALEEDKPIAVEGTNYVLTPRGLTPPMQMASKGYEGAVSGGIAIDVARKDADKTTTFQRMVLARYPERSPDFVDEDGKKKRVQDRVDNDIELTFLDGSRDQYWLVQKQDDTYEMIHRRGDGSVAVNPSKVGDAFGPPQEGTGQPMLAFAEYTPHAMPRPIARWVPETARPMSVTAAEVIQYSAIEMKMSSGTWQVTDFPVPFIEYDDQQTSLHEREPTTVNVPGVGPVRLVLSTLRRPLPAILTLAKFDLIKYAGASRTKEGFVEDYRSTVDVVDKRTGAEKVVMAHLNSPADDNGLSLFQARWDGDPTATPDKRFTELGVGNRPGIQVMVTGAILMVIGVLYSFYVKPLLLNWRKAQLAAYAAKGVA